MKPGKMHKGYYIRDKETHQQWRAPSGKTVWATPGAAKSAYSYRSARLDGNGIDWYKRPTRTDDRGYTMVIPFNDQDKYEIVELSSEVSEAINLLRECCNSAPTIEGDLYEKLVAFLDKADK